MKIATSNEAARSPSLIATLITAALLLLPGGGTPAEAESTAAAVGKVRAELNIGYSLLYQQADGIPKMKWLLMFKSKHDDLARTTTGMMDYYQQLAQSLEKVAAQNPAVHLDATTMPELLAETRKAIGIDMAKDFAPLVGSTGLAFERELLLMFYNALDEQRHLVGVMIEREPEPGLLSFLRQTKEQLESRRGKLRELLDRRYFRQEAVS